MKELELIGDKAWVFLSHHGPRMLAIVALAAALAVLIRSGRRMFERRFLADKSELSKREKRADTLGRILEGAGLTLVGVMAALMLIEEVGIDVKPVLASLGIGGVALGFGAQSLVKDVISGFFILLEDQVRVGDVIETAGKSGLVEKVGLRSLVLRDVSGNRIIIPNGQIDVVTNMSYEYSRAVLDIGVAYKEDVDRVIELIKAVGAEMQKDEKYREVFLEPLEVLGLDSFGDSAVVIKARIMTKPLKQWEVKREFNRRLKIVFDRESVEIPFPQRTVHLLREKSTSAAKGEIEPTD